MGDVFYIVSPRPKLTSLLRDRRGEISDGVFSSGMWFGKIPISYRLSSLDSDELVKVLFLLSLSDLMPKESSAVCAEGQVEFEVSPSFFDRFWTLKPIPEDGNINDCIAMYADDPRFQKFAQSSSSAVQSFVNSAASREQMAAAKSSAFSAGLLRLIHKLFVKN